MKTKCLLAIVGATALWLSVPQGCRPTGGDLVEDTGGSSGAGGAAGNGGASASGGSSGAGGGGSAGGTTVTGGSSGSGGGAGSGGESRSGGDRSSGGAIGSGGARPSGGAAGRGGISGSGGNTLRDGGSLDVRAPVDGSRFETSTVRRDTGGVDLRDGPRRFDVSPSRDTAAVASTDGRRG